MKTVIHVWTNNCKNIKYNKDDTSSYWGLGDLIRGTIKLYQLQRYLKFKLLIDISLHPAAPFLKPIIHEYNNYVLDNKNNIHYCYIDTLKNYLITQFKEKDIVLVTTNDKNIETLQITDDCKIFIKNILQPTEELLNYIKNITKNNILYLTGYNILHIRLGDNFLIKNEDNILNYKEFTETLESNKTFNRKTDIILTDNMEFKKYLLSCENIVTPDINVSHIGIETNLDNSRDTLAEFFIAINASSIKTFSVYHWISGFVNWISILYNIPLQKTITHYT